MRWPGCSGAGCTTSSSGRVSTAPRELNRGRRRTRRRERRVRPSTERGLTAPSPISPRRQPRHRAGSCPKELRRPPASPGRQGPVDAGERAPPGGNGGCRPPRGRQRAARTERRTQCPRCRARPVRRRGGLAGTEHGRERVPYPRCSHEVPVLRKGPHGPCGARQTTCRSPLGQPEQHRTERDGAEARWRKLARQSPSLE